MNKIASALWLVLHSYKVYWIYGIEKVSRFFFLAKKQTLVLSFFEPGQLRYSCSIWTHTPTHPHTPPHAHNTHPRVYARPIQTIHTPRVLLEIDRVPWAPQTTGTSYYHCGSTRTSRTCKSNFGGKPRCSTRFDPNWESNAGGCAPHLEAPPSRYTRVCEAAKELAVPPYWIFLPVASWSLNS